MRIERAQPKLLRTVAVPTQLQGFLLEVAEKIAARDEEAVIPSDDLLQADDACGGLIEEDGDTYRFTYYPEIESDASWQFALTTADIELIATGTKGTLQLWGCATESCDSLFADPLAKCFNCDYREEAPKLPPDLYDDKLTWGKEFFSLNPDARGFHLREIVKGDPELSRLYEDFTSDEIDKIQQEARGFLGANARRPTASRHGCEDRSMP